jgi:hypothetical protein
MWHMGRPAEYLQAMLLRQQWAAQIICLWGNGTGK